MAMAMVVEVEVEVIDSMQNGEAGGWSRLPWWYCGMRSWLHSLWFVVWISEVVGLAVFFCFIILVRGFFRSFFPSSALVFSSIGNEPRHPPQVRGGTCCSVLEFPRFDGFYRWL